MKILKKISVGSINNVRGGLKGVKGRVRIMTVAGVINGYKEKVSETMKTSYAFSGEIRAINADGEEALAPVAYLPEPAQGLLKQQIDAVGQGSAVEFGFNFYAVESSTSVTGYEFECEPLMEAKKSTALEALTARIGFEGAANASVQQLGHDEPGTEAPAKSNKKK